MILNTSFDRITQPSTCKRKHRVRASPRIRRVVACAKTNWEITRLTTESAAAIPKQQFVRNMDYNLETQTHHSILTGVNYAQKSVHARKKYIGNKNNEFGYPH